MGTSLGGGWGNRLFGVKRGGLPRGPLAEESNGPHGRAEAHLPLHGSQVSGTHLTLVGVGRQSPGGHLRVAGRRLVEDSASLSSLSSEPRSSSPFI